MFEKAALNKFSGKLLLLLFVFFQVLFMAFFSLGWSIFKDTTLAHHVRQDSNLFENTRTLSGAEFFQLGEVSYELKKLVEGYILEGKSKTDILTQLGQEFLFLAKMESFYDQIRLFDDKGFEIIRVDNQSDGQSLIGQELLEDKSARPYFAKAVQLETDEYFLTRPKAMTENGVLLIPIRIVIQSFFPVDDKRTGERFGYININLDADLLFGEIKANLKMANGQTHILASDGRWIFSREPGEDFEMFIGQEVSFKNNSPEIWNAIAGREKGVFNFQETTVVFNKINIVPDLTNPKIRAFEINLKPENQKFVDGFYLVSIIKPPTYTELLGVSPNQTFLIWGGYIVFTFLLSFYISFLVATRAVMQERTRHSLKMEAVGQFTGGLAHDFNNLLTAVIGNLGLLDREKPSKKAKTLISNALDAAWRGAELTKRLLAFSRKQNLEPKDIAINELVEETRPLIETILGDGRILEIKLPKEALMARLDPIEFQNVVLNLVINARDAMATGDKLSIKVYRENYNRDSAKRLEISPGYYIVTEITDTGEGMSEEVQKQAINPFFTTKEIGEGSGLGLSMAYGFARQSGGQLKIFSEEGKGTTLLILIPEIE